ncbi:glycine/D-amino acid oxidase, deaminating [Acidovorax sp. CF316]|uniref:FAD-dependent oxidoreductase n=1 Tax=Acidovorax sp. CF316 TaxID=1144317 RepID=UPI00026BC742|nr:FAD-dependent oxidoreductase [Acidovorax sp. CF316]EJE52313.1 glycine/D-amino acid oxidase, deaminating [Acidovorax sp. CF316]
MLRIAVIGGGIVGLTTARALVARGHEVVLLDQGPGPAGGASAQNGAQLSYAYVAPLAAPSIFAQLPSLLLSPSSPLRLRPGLDPAAWRWCLQFMAACTQARADATTRQLLHLAGDSHSAFQHWRANVPAARIEHATQGKLVLYRSAAGLESASRQVQLQQAMHGPLQQVLTGAECCAREPALDPAATLAGGIWTPSEEVADCARVCTALADELASGPRFTALWNHRFLAWDCQGSEPRGLLAEHDGTQQRIAFDACVVAAGAQTPGLLRPLGVGGSVSIQPLKGYSIDVAAGHIVRMPATSLTDTATKTVFAPLGTGPTRRLRVAGFAELVGQDTRIDHGRIALLVDSVRQLFGLRGTPGDVRPWAGLRPATPTGLPCIGRAGGLRNLFVNSGQGALGFTLAFGSAERLAAHFEGKAPASHFSSSAALAAGNA